MCVAGGVCVRVAETLAIITGRSVGRDLGGRKARAATAGSYLFEDLKARGGGGRQTPGRLPAARGRQVALWEPHRTLANFPDGDDGRIPVSESETVPLLVAGFWIPP